MPFPRQRERVREQEIEPRRRRSLCLGVLLMLAIKGGRERVYEGKKERDTHL